MSTNVSKILTYYLIQSHLSKKNKSFTAPVMILFLENLCIFQKQALEVFYVKKLYLQISKYLQESWRPATLLKIDSNKGVFL